MKRFALLCLAIIFAAWTWYSLQAAESEPGAAEEQILKAARLKTDGPALLEFFRKRTHEADADKLKALIKQLGDDAFSVREKASTQLIELGPVALPYLREAAKHADPEVARRAEECLRLIKQESIANLATAAARLLALRKPAGSAEVLLAYLPFADDDAVAEEVRKALAAVAVRDGKAEPVLVTALTDKTPLKRGAAGEALARAGIAEQKTAVRKLLKDAEPAVRVRVALALVGEKEAIPVLIDALAELQPNERWPVEEFLYRVADDKSPLETPGTDADARKKYRDAWAAWWKEHGNKVDLTALDAKPKTLGYTLVILLDAGKVVDLDADNKPRWQIEKLQFPLDAQLLPGARVLVAEHNGGKVTLRNRKGDVLWEVQVQEPLSAQRLANGNTFIGTRSKLIELDRAGKEVFSYADPNGELFMKAQKLDNGDIAFITSGQKYVRLDPAGKQVHSFQAAVSTYGGRIDVLPNGNVLVPIMHNNMVVEYDTQGKVVWQVNNIAQPINAIRLANGNTVITTMEEHRAYEVNREGKQVWTYQTDTRVTRAWRR